MENKITKENYIGYKKLYLLKKEKLASATLVILTAGMKLGLTFIMTYLIQDITQIPNLLLPVMCVTGPAISYVSISDAIKNYKNNINGIKTEYPCINSKIKTNELHEMLEDYKYISGNYEDKKITKEDLLYNEKYPSLNYKYIPEEELERTKVKIKTLNHNKK